MTDNLSTLFPPPPHVHIPEEALALAGVLRSWVHREILTSRLAYRERYNEAFDQRLKSLRELGLGDVLKSEASGGLGLGSAAVAPGLVSILLEIGRADAALATVFALEFSLQSVVTSMDSDDRLRELAFGEAQGRVGLSLPGAGLVGEETPLFRGRALRARTLTSGSAHSISGDSLRVLGACANVGTLVGVPCSDDQELPGLAFVKTTLQGVTFGQPRRTTGLEAIPMADLSLENINLEGAFLMKGEQPLMELTNWLDLLLGATSLGAAMNFFEILADWSEDRQIKGTGKLKENPLCASVLATVAEEIATSTVLLYSLAEMIAADPEGDQDRERLFAYSQLLGSRVQRGAFTSIDRGLELMGSAGYAKEWHAEKHWRDVKTLKSIICGAGGEVPAQLDGARFFLKSEEV